jgi:hypothetical protein
MASILPEIRHTRSDVPKAIIVITNKYTPQENVQKIRWRIDITKARTI